MTLDDLKEALIAAGFRIGQDALRVHRGVSWYAWRTTTDVPDCATNEKTPSLIVWPCAAPEGFPSYGYGDSVEFEICADAGDDTWVKLIVYTVKAEDAMRQLPKVERVLCAAWTAAVAANAQPEIPPDGHRYVDEDGYRMQID